MSDIIDIIGRNTAPYDSIEKIMNALEIREFVDSNDYRAQLDSKLEYFKQNRNEFVPWIEAIPHVAKVVEDLQLGRIVSSDDKVTKGTELLNELISTDPLDKKIFARFVIAQYSLLRLLRFGKTNFKHVRHCRLYKKPRKGEIR
ncbi:MAG: hypothetical protein LBH62_05640 [Nitrososphaerota archaeon]|jgi:hypothetical protein|nr:hypothetical protein [Nitrososphaerota archaeon]